MNAKNLSIIPFFFSKIILILSLILPYGCKTVNIVNEKNMRIRYLNINLIFEFMIKHDQEAKELKNRNDNLIKTIDMIEKSLLNNIDKAEKELLQQKKKQHQLELQKIINLEDYLKEKILNKIYKVIKSLARHMEIDFVLSIGNNVLFANKKYDITEYLIEEIIKLKKRNAPVSR